MKHFAFSVESTDKKTRARTGLLKTPHGVLQTPAFVPVGTQATVKSLSPEDLSILGVQIYFVNTYHMYLRPGIDVIEQCGGLHAFMAWNKPLITDSGGFQVFSLSRGRVFGRRGGDEPPLGNEPPVLSRITERGVEFRSHWDGTRHAFTPEKSIEVQHRLGADIILAFDDCTPYPATHEQAKISMERTHIWAKSSLEKHNLLKSKNRSANSPVPALYGVVQGSTYEDLRTASARFIAALGFDGIAIGGVSVGEKKVEMKRAVTWVVPHLPAERPRHLLGVGEIDDIFTLVSLGIDTFDCVAPTRLARMGHVYTKISNSKAPFAKAQDKQISNKNTLKFTIDITHSSFARDRGPVDADCTCSVCSTFSRAYIHHLFRVHELLAYRLATIHNIHFIVDLVRSIRRSIGDGTFLALERKWLYNNS